MSDGITAPTLPRPREQERTRRQPPYHVILLDDDDHTFEYVIGMLQQLFGHPREKGFARLFATHPSIDDRVAALVKFGGGRDTGPIAEMPVAPAPAAVSEATPADAPHPWGEPPAQA